MSLLAGDIAQKVLKSEDYQPTGINHYAIFSRITSVCPTLTSTYWQVSQLIGWISKETAQNGFLWSTEEPWNQQKEEIYKSLIVLMDINDSSSNRESIRAVNLDSTNQQKLKEIMWI